MRKLIYFAVFEPSTNGTFGVYFPDLPGCISMGDNFQYAQGMAAEALGLHLWGMEKDGDFIPEPSQSPFSDIPDGSIIVPVTVFPEVVKNEMERCVFSVRPARRFPAGRLLLCTHKDASCILPAIW